MIANPCIQLTMSGNTTVQSPGAAAVFQMVSTTGTLTQVIHTAAEVGYATGATTGVVLKRAGIWKVSFTGTLVTATAAGAGLIQSVYLATTTGTAFPGTLRVWDHTVGGLTYSFHTEVLVTVSDQVFLGVRPYLSGAADAAFYLSDATLTAIYLG